MTTKDYIKLADALSRTKPEDNQHTYRQWAEVRAAIAQVLFKDNTKFNIELFYRATEK